MKLSIVIACVNDAVELNHTIRSIRATAGDQPEIVVVDDCSGCSVWIDDVAKVGPIQVLHNRHRCGVGPSRHIGALAATGDWLLITDSHMRFTEGWYETAMLRYLLPTQSHWNTLICGTCLQLDEKHMDVKAPAGEYNTGAIYNWFGPDRNDPKAPTQILECIWTPKDAAQPNDWDDIPAVMGADYFISKEWFMHIDALSHLRSWGGDELMLSMKTWLAGGSVKLARDIRIGHRWQMKGEHKAFNPPCGHTLWNKAFAAHTLFPGDMAAFFENELLAGGPKEEGRDRDACKRLIKDDWHVIAAEKARNQTIFTRDLQWLMDKFHVADPREGI